MAYKKDGIKFPRCTEIISDATNKSGGLVQWSANQAVEWIRENVQAYNIGLGFEEGREEILTYSATEADLEQARFAYKDTSRIALDVGSEVHNTIEMYLKGERVNPLSSDQAVTAFEAFLKWEREVDLTPLALEQTVWGDRWAGTLDFYGYYKDKLYVIDWKTSKAFYPEMRYQVAAYRNAKQSDDIGRLGNGNYLHIEHCIEGCGVLMLNKETGMPTFKDTSKTYENDLSVFNKMVELYYLRHPIIRKRFEKGEK